MAWTGSAEVLVRLGAWSGSGSWCPCARWENAGAVGMLHAALGFSDKHSHAVSLGSLSCLYVLDSAQERGTEYTCAALTAPSQWATGLTENELLAWLGSPQHPSTQTAAQLPISIGRAPRLFCFCSQCLHFGYLVDQEEKEDPQRLHFTDDFWLQSPRLAGGKRELKITIK